MSPASARTRHATLPKRQTLVLGPALNGIRLSAEEFDSVTEFNEDFHYELIDGVLIVNPIPSPGLPSANTSRLLAPGSCR